MTQRVLTHEELNYWPGKPPNAPNIIDLNVADGRTDTANGKRFAAMHGRNARWCEPWGKWLTWTGKNWAKDDRRQSEAMAKETADEVWRQAANLMPRVEHAEARDLLRFCNATSKARGIADMLHLAKSESGMTVLPNDLNRDVWKFNCDNGTLDLKTGELHPHSRADLLTSICPTEYLPAAEAECPLWESTVEVIFGHNADLAKFVQRFLGSSLVGTVLDHVLLIFWGGGSNGKSLLVETILDVLGPDFATKAPKELLLATRGDRHPTEIADLYGKRFVVATETDDGRRLAEGVVKELSGGDTLKARRMREDFWGFKPSHSLVLVTNHKPRVSGVDNGIWRRLRLVPFVQKFWDPDRGEHGPPELQMDKRLKEKLQAERPGILRWLVEGCRRWQEIGLGEPEEVKAATADYRAKEDVLAAFFAECLLEGSNFTAKASDVRQRYENWCKANGEKPISGRRLGEAITARDITRSVSNGTWYHGIALQNLEP